MSTSEITKNYRKKYWTTFIISTLLFLGTCAFLVIFGFITAWKPSEDPVSSPVKDALIAVYGGLLLSLIAAIVVFILIKEKIRNTIWMANLVLSVILFGQIGMWVILIFWGIDEYVLVPLYRKYATNLNINKQMDRRL